MKIAALMLAALAAACAGSSGGAGSSPQAPQNPSTTNPEVRDRRIPVWIFVAPEQELRNACREQTVPESLRKEKPPSGQSLPNRMGLRDVLVPLELLKGSQQTMRFPLSCMGRQMVPHEEAHKKLPETVIGLSFGARESALFLSMTKFRLLAVNDRDPKPSLYPFDKKVLNVPTPYDLSHETGPFMDKGLVGRIYKIVFEIGNFKVDPDIECKP